MENPFQIPNDIAQAEQKRQIQNDRIRKGKQVAHYYKIQGSENMSAAQMQIACSQMAAALNLIKAREDTEALESMIKKKQATSTYNQDDEERLQRAIKKLYAIKTVLEIE